MKFPHKDDPYSLDCELVTILTAFSTPWTLDSIALNNSIFLLFSHWKSNNKHHIYILLIFMDIYLKYPACKLFQNCTNLAENLVKESLALDPSLHIDWMAPASPLTSRAGVPLRTTDTLRLSEHVPLFTNTKRLLWGNQYSVFSPHLSCEWKWNSK